MTPYEVCSLILQMATVGGLIFYAIETRRIRKISFEALEAPHKPRVGLSGITMDQSDDGLITAAQEDRPIRLLLSDRNLGLYNGGSGPALRLRMRILDAQDKETYDTHLPALDPTVMLPSSYPRTALDTRATILLTYESINGVPYERRIVIANQKEIIVEA